MSNLGEFVINTLNRTRSFALSSRAADRHRLLRLWLMGFVLLGLTLGAVSTQACRIEHNNPNTVTIRGECGEAVLMSELSIAITRLEASGELSRAEKSYSQSDRPKPPGRLDLVNGVARGNGSTFFHRSPGKK